MAPVAPEPRRSWADVTPPPVAPPHYVPALPPWLPAGKRPFWTTPRPLSATERPKDAPGPKACVVFGGAQIPVGMSMHGAGNEDINIAPDQCTGIFAPNECQCQAITAHKRSHSFAAPQRQGAFQANQRPRSNTASQRSRDATSQRRRRLKARLPAGQRPPSQRAAPQRPHGAAGECAAGAGGHAVRAHPSGAGGPSAAPGQRAQRPEGFLAREGARAEGLGLVLAQRGQGFAEEVAPSLHLGLRALAPEQAAHMIKEAFERTHGNLEAASAVLCMAFREDGVEAEPSLRSSLGSRNHSKVTIYTDHGSGSESDFDLPKQAEPSYVQYAMERRARSPPKDSRAQEMEEEASAKPSQLAAEDTLAEAETDDSSGQASEQASVEEGFLIFEHVLVNILVVIMNMATFITRKVITMILLTVVIISVTVTGWLEDESMQLVVRRGEGDVLCSRSLPLYVGSHGLLPGGFKRRYRGPHEDLESDDFREAFDEQPVQEIDERCWNYLEHRCEALALKRGERRARVNALRAQRAEEERLAADLLGQLRAAVQQADIPEESPTESAPPDSDARGQKRSANNPSKKERERQMRKLEAEKEANSRLLDYKKAVQWFVENWPRWLREEPPLEFPLERQRELLFGPMPGTRSAMQGLLAELEEPPLFR
eukprot:s3767_g2.t1